VDLFGRLFFFWWDRGLNAGLSLDPISKITKAKCTGGLTQVVLFCSRHWRWPFEGKFECTSNFLLLNDKAVWIRHPRGGREGIVELKEYVLARDV
jgi:hypothetical protein